MGLVLGGGGWCHVAKNGGLGGGGKLEKASKREEELEKEQQFKINNIQENNIQKERPNMLLSMLRDAYMSPSPQCCGCIKYCGDDGCPNQPFTRP